MPNILSSTCTYIKYSLCQAAPVQPESAPLLSVMAHAQDKFIHHCGVYWNIYCVRQAGHIFFVFSYTEILGLNVAVLVDLIGRRLCNWLSFRFMSYAVERLCLGFPVRKNGNAVPLWHGMRMPWYMGLLFVISLHWKCSIAEHRIRKSENIEHLGFTQIVMPMKQAC